MYYPLHGMGVTHHHRPRFVQPRPYFLNYPNWYGMGQVDRYPPQPPQQPQQQGFYPQQQYQQPTECPPVAQGVTAQVPGQQLAALASGQVQSLKVVGIDSYGRGVTLTLLAQAAVQPAPRGMQGYGQPMFAPQQHFYQPQFQAYDAPMAYSDPSMGEEEYPYSELPVG